MPVYYILYIMHRFCCIFVIRHHTSYLSHPEDHIFPGSMKCRFGSRVEKLVSFLEVSNSSGSKFRMDP